MVASFGPTPAVRMPGTGHLYAGMRSAGPDSSQGLTTRCELEAELQDLPDGTELPAPRGATTGERVARRFFELCESPRTRLRTMKVLRSSADSAVGGRLLVAFLSRTVFRPALRSRRVDVAAVRLELVAAQLGGIAVLRYVTRMEPVASMPVDDLVAAVAPSIQATLSGR